MRVYFVVISIPPPLVRTPLSFVIDGFWKGSGLGDLFCRSTCRGVHKDSPDDGNILKIPV